MGFERACGLEAGSKHKGRPIVWETCEVRMETNHTSSRFASFYLCPLLPANVKNAPGPPPFTYAPEKTCRSPMTPTYHPPSALALTLATQPLSSVYVHVSMDTYGRASSASVFCDEVVGVPRRPSKPTLVNAAQGPVLSNARPCSDKYFDHQPLTSQ